MAKITYIDFNGMQRVIDAPTGHSVMEGAINNNVRGVIAECGGACSCATCHVYVDDAWADKLNKPDDMEDAMLDAVVERKANSRLSCQIKISDALDGLVVHLPEKQV